MNDFDLRHWRPQPRPKSIHLHPSPPSPSGTSSDGYTSLCEIISPRANGSAVRSPTASEIRIRNPLVKQAAYAYLQPTPSTTDASSSSRRRCCPSLRRALSLFRSCFGFIGRLLHSIRIRKPCGPLLR